MRVRNAVVVFLAVLVVAAPASATHDTRTGSRFKPAKVSRTGGVVASISNYASAVGIDVLDRGGNAIDAAVAMVFAVGVARPEMGGIGGGGFLVYRGANGRTAALDLRELSPRTEEFDGDILTGPGIHASGDGHRVVGVPGVVAGMDAALDKLGSGRFGLGDLITNRGRRTTPYAHELARDGVRITGDIQRALGPVGGPEQKRMCRYDATAETYCWTKNPPMASMTLKQPGYAKSLAFIAHNGADAFYEDATFPDPETGLPRDSIARLIARDMALAAEFSKETENDIGYLTVEDFEHYRAVWRTPLTSTYHGHDIVTIGAPAAGAPNIEALNLLEGFPLGTDDEDISDAQNADTSWARSSANHLHVLAEARKIALEDHNAYTADPDHAYDYDGDGDGDTDPMPVQTMTAKSYADVRRDEIHLQRAKALYRPQQDCGTTAETSSPTFTNHLSVMDRDGNAVSVTTSLGNLFGSSVVASGTGFLLNNQLTDFDISAPGAANASAPSKRPRSSGSPTVVVRDGTTVLAVGGAGGSFIPLGVVQMVDDVVDYGLDIAHAIDGARVQPKGCSLHIESNRDEARRKNGEPEGPNQRVPDAVLAELESRGHVIRPAVFLVLTEYQLSPILAAVGVNEATGLREAVSDPRNEEFDVDPGQGAMAQTP